jgi:hypothetical protein
MRPNGSNTYWQVSLLIGIITYRYEDGGCAWRQVGAIWIEKHGRQQSCQRGGEFFLSTN